MKSSKQQIIDIFNANVKGRRCNTSGYNTAHDGAEGHWLETQMGITPNATNGPDILGYEMKKDTKGKTTFGDWSPDITLWGRKRPYEQIRKLNRDTEFLRFFGKPNLLKGGRLSWSGEPVPTIGRYNNFGQFLYVDEDDNILACYSYSHDTRDNKSTLIPESLQIDGLILAKWSKENMKQRVEAKFNELGWFKCFKGANGTYEQIGFAEPLNFEMWIDLVKQGVVFFDSGMYAGNKRPYAQWRASNTYWHSRITETY